MILLLHNRYRVPGGEERAVEDLAWLIREHLGEDVEVLERDSAALSPARGGARGCCAAASRPEEVGEAVRRTGARVVHAHNVNPTLGWRALAAARAAGARVVLHLHNYRLVCAVGTCFTHGEDCTRCHGRNTLPGVRLNCRGGSPAESAAYAAGAGAVAAAGSRTQADAFVVPSAFALRRLRELGAPVDDRARCCGRVQREFAERSRRRGGPPRRSYAGRLSHEKGVADAIDGLRARRAAARGRGRRARRGRAARAGGGADVRFTGRVGAGGARGAAPRGRGRGRPLALRGDPAARRARGDGGGLPVVAARAGGLAELVPEEGLYPPGDVAALAARARAGCGATPRRASARCRRARALRAGGGRAGAARGLRL